VTEAGGEIRRLDGLIDSEPAVTTIFATAPGLGGPLASLLSGAAGAI
jgi:hypothetical protein